MKGNLCKILLAVSFLFLMPNLCMSQNLKGIWRLVQNDATSQVTRYKVLDKDGNYFNVDAYIKDPLCGFDFTAQAFIDMLEGMADVYRGTDWNCNDPELPIRFESGAMDPCFEPGGLKRAVERLESIGYRNVSYRLIEGCRHEIYNDIKRDELIIEFGTWLDECLKMNRR